MKIVIFGSGQRGQEAFEVFSADGYTVDAFLDNDPQKIGGTICGIPVISPEQYKTEERDEKIVLASMSKYQLEMEKQLIGLGITDYEYYDRSLVFKRKRLLSYCSVEEMEDVILYYLFEDEDEIFYIDVGSNDPVVGSVTKLLYDMKNASGINIEPQPWLCEITRAERPRDITVCAGVGEKEGMLNLYLQEGCSTFEKENVIIPGCRTIDVEIVTLRSICENNIRKGKKISFLKIDVEGHEMEVLEGADLVTYHPEIVIMESTVPCTMIPTHEKWEPLLLEAGYRFIFQKGVNRYYSTEDQAVYFRSKIEAFGEWLKGYHIFRTKLF